MEVLLLALQLGFAAVEEERHDRTDQEEYEQEFRDSGRPGGDATEAQYRGHDRDDEEHDGVVEHDDLAC
jgi:hypothetical protein